LNLNSKGKGSKEEVFRGGGDFRRRRRRRRKGRSEGSQMPALEVTRGQSDASS
jgi:hypothetical protein